MVVFAGPFLGEFGWELSYWHAWLRYLKENHYKNSKMIVSSYPGREALYEFADEFIPISNDFIKKNYSQRAFFLDFKGLSLSILNQDLYNLYNYLDKKIPHNEYLHISCFPQKTKTTNLFYRIKRLLKIYGNKSNNLNNQNNYAGKIIPDPFHLNFPYKEKKYYPQYPSLKNQIFKELISSSKIDKITRKIIQE